MTADPDLAHLAGGHVGAVGTDDAHLDSVERLARGAQQIRSGPTRIVILGRQQRDQTRRLGQAVDLCVVTLEQSHRDSVEQLASMSTTAPTRLRAAFVRGFEDGTSVPELRSNLVPWLEQTEAAFAERLRAAVAERSIRDVDSDEYARLLIATGTGGAFLFLTSPDATPDPTAPLRTILDLLIH